MNGNRVRDPKAYFTEAARWDHDRLAAAERSRRRAWILALISFGLAGSATLAIAGLTPLKTVEPFVVRVDKTTGAVDVISGLRGEVTPDEAVSKYFIAQYVRARAGWLPAAAAENFRLVAILSAPAEQRRFAETWRAANPERPPAAYGPDAVAEVEIRAISFINPKVASVRYRRTVTRAQTVVTDDWVATLSFAYTRAPMREADRLRNPLGFQVHTYRTDPEVAA